MKCVAASCIQKVYKSNKMPKNNLRNAAGSLQGNSPPSEQHRTELLWTVWTGTAQMIHGQHPDLKQTQTDEVMLVCVTSQHVVNNTNFAV